MSLLKSPVPQSEVALGKGGVNGGIGLPGLDAQQEHRAQASLCPQERGCIIPVLHLLLHSCCGSCCLPVLSPELLSPLSGCCPGVWHTQCGPAGMPLPQLCAASQGSAPFPIDNRCQLMSVTYPHPDHLSAGVFEACHSYSCLHLGVTLGT